MKLHDNAPPLLIPWQGRISAIARFSVQPSYNQWIPRPPPPPRLLCWIIGSLLVRNPKSGRGLCRCLKVAASSRRREVPLGYGMLYQQSIELPDARAPFVMCSRGAPLALARHAEFELRERDLVCQFGNDEGTSHVVSVWACEVYCILCPLVSLQTPTKAGFTIVRDRRLAAYFDRSQGYEYMRGVAGPTKRNASHPFAVIALVAFS